MVVARRAIQFALAGISAIVCASAQAQLVAERITVENAATRLFSGSDATGGVGDWYLSNGINRPVIFEGHDHHFTKDGPVTFVYET